MSVRIKICGITRVEDACALARFGADAQGLVFYAKSPRCVADLPAARAIVQAAGPFVTSVGLFVDPAPQWVHQVLAQVPIHLLQFHGNERNDFCAAFGRPFIKALRMKPGLDLDAEMALYPDAQGFLLDTYKAGVPGGTGEAFDWSRSPKACAKAWILAGGLTPELVAEAVMQTSPYGVDVSGGVESAPGVKCHQKMHDFIKRARGHA